MDSLQEKNLDRLKKTARTLPERPGVYLYAGKNGRIIYVGKAVNLKRRVSQYFTGSGAVGEKTALLVSQIRSLRTIETVSEFDALLLEAKLIRRYLPRYNVISRDDKSPVYIVLTMDHLLPAVILCRKSSLPDPVPRGRRVFGPFQSSRVARMLLRTIRRSIPYCTEKQRNGTPCFYTHLGLCDPCPSVIAALPQSPERSRLVRRYRRNISAIASILSGRHAAVRRSLERTMNRLSDTRRFEEAADIHRQLTSLYELIGHRFDPSLYTTNDSLAPMERSHEGDDLRRHLLPYLPDLQPLRRVECVDIATIGGADTTGSLVVLIDGIPDHSWYRRFRMKNGLATDDTKRIAEVVTRRFAHPEWPFPDLLVIDGGKGQVDAARTALREKGIMTVPVIGLAKRREEIICMTGDQYRNVILPLSSPALHLLERIRDEAHRFARVYHHFLRRQHIPRAAH
ncbi:GIY-YIG nuclease family protein [Patescibacteria group bacterium]|nr:GIY-YIG nuclease family protein [Patescibacteria group bacterium]